VKTRFSVLATILIAVVALPAAAAAAPAENPCESKEAKQLLCPNLRIGPASELYVENRGVGEVLLRATSDVRSRGRGPMELVGHRNGWRTMRTNQRIWKVGGGYKTVKSDATLRFTDVGYQFGGAYWKVHQLARFDLRPVEPDGSFGDPVRISPKLNYCLRDLERTRPGQRSPSQPHYPACKQDPGIVRDTLGTSVGWSDIYPADYDKQYIDVSGLRGCFAFTMTVDPKHHLFESNEHDNSSHRRVQLPFTGAGC
jgi:hypothetical protein